MKFELSSIHVGAALMLGIIIGIMQYQCESQQAEKARAEAAAQPTPDERLAMIEAKATLRGAQRAGLNDAMREVNRKLHIMRRKHDQKAPTGEQTDALTILFSANNHGEREDCGCKHNPLGGLTRRQTLVELAGEPSAKESKRWWGSDLAEPDALFVVDAGDLFFRSTTLDHHPPGLQDEARAHAKAVAAAMAVAPPDAANVGEVDLVFGLDTYKQLVAKAHLPVVSANLRTTGGEQPFEGHRVVERDGKKVAFIGLIKPKSRVQKYFEKRALSVEPPAKAYAAEVAKLPEDVDLVVMLSNMGVKRTAELIEDLAQDDVRVDAAITSNTNRLTRDPVWAAGVPIVEPLSRGKYLGRLDVSLGAEPGVAYANALEDPKKVVQDYRSAWTSYFNAWDKRAETEREIARKKKELADQKDGAEKDGSKKDGADNQAKNGKEKAKKEGKGEAGKFVEDGAKRTESRIAYLEKLVKTLDKRVATASKQVARQTRDLGTVDEVVTFPDGDDWASVRIVPVKLDIPQDKQVRRALDRSAQKAN